MANTTTTAYRVFSSAKINSISLWGPMASDLAPVTVTIEYQSPTATGIGAPNRLKSDTSVGSTACAFIRASPPRNSLAGNWIGQAGTSTLFTLTGPVNTIVDLNITFVLQNGETPTAVTNAVAGATVGQVYCRGLDALSAAGTVIPPVSYSTI